MKKTNIAGICLLTVTFALMFMYEVTAKSPRLLGHPLPGWIETQRVEKVTRWNPPTGIMPLDKFLHEGEEAIRYYGFLLG